MKYVAFIRGINVGGKQMKMEKLREMLAQLGFTDIKTILASGNAVFETEPSDTLKNTIEQAIVETFGYSASIILRTRDEIQAIAANNPFQNIEVTKQTRLYVTFLSETPTNTLPIPYTDSNYQILRVTDGEIYSVLTVTPERGTTDAMAILEKTFGKNITTRNWNTIEKVVKA